MTDIARLGLEVDSRDVPRASRNLDDFTQSSGRAERGAANMERGGRNMAAGMRVAAAGIAAAAASFVSLSQVMRSSESYTRMTNSLRAIGQSGSEAAATLDQLGAIANRTRSPLEATAQLYQRISIAGQDLGASSEQVMSFTENVGLALAQTGTSAQEASGALLQLSQAMSGGVVRAEEFNSILEGAFPIAQAAARGIEGAAGSVGQLRNMVIEGEVSSREFFNAILSQSEQLEEAFASTVPTISQAFTVLGNNITSLIGQLDSGAGVSSAFAQAIIYIAENLDRLAVYAGVAVTVIGVRYAGAMAIAAARTYGLSGALVALRGALVRTGFGALIVGAGELIYQFTQLVSSAGGFGAAMGEMANVGRVSFSAISDVAQELPAALSAVWQSIRAGFERMVSDLLDKWAAFIRQMASGLRNLEGVSILGATPFEGISNGIMGMANDAQEASNDFFASSMDLRRSAEDNFGAVGAAAIRAGSRVRDAVNGLRETIGGPGDDVAPPSSTSGGTRLAGAGTGVGGAVDAASGGSGGGGSVGAAKSQVEDLARTVENDLNNAAQTGANAMSNLFTSIIGGAGSAKQAVGQLISQIGGNLISGGFQSLASSGADGGFIAGLGSLLSGRASGGPVRAGEPYLVNERTPNSEVMVPSRSGGVLNVPQAQAALRDSAGGTQRVQVELVSDGLTLSDNGAVMGRVDARVRQSEVQTRRDMPNQVRQTMRQDRNQGRR